MSCRRVHELLSAYIDGELVPEESCFVEGHLCRCSGCEAELESLRYTKRLLGELARQRPRAELERLLLHEALRIEQRVPADTLWEALRRLGETPIRPRAALATAALSLVTLWAATSRLGGGSEEERPPVAHGAPAGSIAVVDARGEVVGLLVPRTDRPAFFVSPMLDSSPLLTATYRSEPSFRESSLEKQAPYSIGRPRLDQMYLLAGFSQ